MMSGGNRIVCEAVLCSWIQRYGLTQAEGDLLRLTAIDGIARGGLHVIREVEASTVKKQVQIVLRKTGDSSLIAAALRLIREALF